MHKNKQPSNTLLCCWLVVALLLVQALADCPLSRYPRQTTVGYIRADFDTAPNQNLQQVYEYPLVEQLRSTGISRTAVGVYGFSLDKRSDQFGFRVQASMPRSPATTVIFTINALKGTNNDRWKFIALTFIVSEIPELLVGSKNALEFLPTQDPNVLRVADMVPMPASGFNYRANAKIFISGIQLKQQAPLSRQRIAKIDDTINKVKQLQKYSWNAALLKKFVSALSVNKMPSISLSDASFNQNGLLNFQISVSQLEIKGFTYSYVIYLEKVNSDVNYQITSGIFTIGDQQKYYYNELEFDGMKILGLSGFKYSNEELGTVSLDVETGVEGEKNYFMGHVQNIYNQFTMQFFGISTLPGAVCRTCPGSPLIYSQFCVSECPTGSVSSINSDGSFYCHVCPVQNFLIAHEDKRTCVCASGHYLVSPTQSCEMCPYDCLTCNGNTCLTCDTSIPSTFRVLNPRSGRCQCLGSGLLDDFNSQSRKCIQCNPICRTCKGPNVFDCLTCAPGRTLVNGVCRCQENLTQNQNSQCLCLPPYALAQNGRCILTQNRCKENEVLIVLPSGQRACNCKPGFTRSIISNICLRECQSYEQLNYQTEECVCRAGSIRDEKTKICYSCASRVNQQYNPYTKQCECMAGFEMNAQGNCIACPPKTFYNPKNDSCDCVFNYYRRDNTCVKCQNEWDGAGCRKLSNMQGLDL